MLGKLVSRNSVLNLGGFARRHIFTASPTSSAGAPTVPLNKNEFLSKPDLQAVIKGYVSTLKKLPTYGVPQTWSPSVCNREFRTVHKDFIDKFEKIAFQDSNPEFYISMASFITLYMRCTINDIPEMLYFLALERIKVDYSAQPMQLYLNDLIRINNEVNLPFTLRTDSSTDYHGRESGYGCILSNDAGYYTYQNGNFPCAGYPKISHSDIVTESELTAVYKGLQFAKGKEVKSLRILIDSDDVLRILEGKAVKKNFQAVMNLMCKIGILLKELDCYCAGFLYRESNKDCDLLAHLGRLFPELSVSELEIEKYRHFPKFRVGRESLKACTTPITTRTV